MVGSAQATGSLVMGGRNHQTLSINQTDLLAGTRQDMSLFSGGFIKMLMAVVQVAITTGGTLTVRDETNNQNIGTLTIPNGATKGQVFQTPIVYDNNSQKNLFGDDISITPAGFAGAGALNVGVGIDTQ